MYPVQYWNTRPPSVFWVNFQHTAFVLFQQSSGFVPAPAAAPAPAPEPEPEEEEKDEDDKIDPVMKKYMEMVAQQKQKEREVKTIFLPSLVLCVLLSFNLFSFLLLLLTFS